MEEFASQNSWNGTSTAARTVANVVLVSAAVGAAYLVLTKPRLRRLAGLAVRMWLGATLPAYLIAETRRAWTASEMANG